MKRNISLVLVLVLLCPLLAGCGAKYCEVDCVDEDGLPVEGVSIKLCSGDLCSVVETDADGKAFLEITEKHPVFEAEIVSLPEGYDAGDDTRTVVSGSSPQMVYVIHKYTEAEIEEMNARAAAEAEAEAAEKEVLEALNDPDALRFSALDTEGSPVNEEIFRDCKVTMINFWEPWCPPCVGEIPDLQALYEKYSGEGFRIIGVYSTDENALDTLSRLGVTYKNLHYSTDFDPFRSGYVPTTVFVDRYGRVIEHDPADTGMQGELPDGLLSRIYVGSKSLEGWEAIILYCLEKAS